MTEDDDNEEEAESDWETAEQVQDNRRDDDGNGNGNGSGLKQGGNAISSSSHTFFRVIVSTTNQELKEWEYITFG